MAIQRCPYCKAIIDEGAEYCSNCGTQLLFPEDEHIEEEIPGEEILDEDVEEESEVLEEELAEEDSKILEAEEDTSEEKDQDDFEEAVDIGEEEIEEVVEKDVPEEKAKSHDEQQDESSIFLEEEEPDEPEEDLQVETGESKPKTDSETKQREEIEEFVAALKREREKREAAVEEEGDLPPWAADMKEVSPSDLPEAEEEDIEEPTYDTEEDLLDIDQTPQKDLTDMDTESALPETVDQQDLPFLEEPKGKVIIERSKPLKSEASSKIASWLKARVFDVLFITAIWFISLWIASQVTAVSVFHLIATSATATVVFLGILLVFYFLFFFLFLKETLGDYLFAQDR